MTYQAMPNPDDFEDFTGRTCEPGKEPKQFGTNGEYWHNDMPMFSFSRPAYNYWNGVANYLRDKGCDDSEIAEFLAHKYMRWMLDHGPMCDTDIQALGYQSAQAYFKDRKPE